MRSLLLACASAVSALVATTASSVALAQPAAPLGSDASGSPMMSGPTITYRRAPSPVASAWDRLGLSGVEFQASGGIFFAGGDSPVQAPSLYPSTFSGNPTGTLLNPSSCPAGQACSPYGIDPFALALSLGWRFLPQASVGAFFSYASYNAQNGADTGDAPDFTSQLSRSQWVLGLYGRYYVTTLSRRLQPWVEVGVGYSYDSASYQRPLGQASNAQPETGFYYANAKGLAVPLTVGLDWRLAPVFSVGPFVGYEPIIPLGGCVEVDVDQFSSVPGKSTCDSSVVSAKYYGVMSGGIFAKVTFDPPAR